MSGSVNKVILVGHLGADPEEHSGDTWCNCTFRMATSESWKDKQTGERQERTEWHSVVIYSEGLVKVAMQYLKKGSKVYIEGQLQTREWEKDGIKRYATEVVVKSFNGGMTLLDSKGSNRAPAPEGDDRETAMTSDDYAQASRGE